MTLGMLFLLALFSWPLALFIWLVMGVRSDDDDDDDDEADDEADNGSLFTIIIIMTIVSLIFALGVIA